MASVVTLVEFFKSDFSSIQDITDELVSSSVDGNYTDFPSISAVFTPSFYNDECVTPRLRQLRDNLAVFEAECDDPGIWNELSDVIMSGRQLCVLLWYSVEWALAKNSAFELLERGTLSACAYLHLASIKGSKAYHIFNPYLYQKCLQVFRSLYRCLTFECREVNIKSRSSDRGKDEKKQQRETMEGDGAEVENELDVAVSFDKEQLKHLFKQASDALFVLLNKVSLSSHSDIPLMTTLLVRDMARIDACQETKVGIVEHYHDFKNLYRLSDRSFALMHKLVDGRHTAGGYLVISRVIYPRLSFWTFSLDVIPSSSAIPVMFTVWKDLMVNFIKIRAEIGDKKELFNIFKMLENLYQRCTDRLEYRTRLAHSVLDVLLVLPRIYQFEFVQRLDVFSRSQKVAVRNYSIEIAPLLLQNLDFSGPDPRFTDCLHDEKASDKVDSSAASVPKTEVNVMEVDGRDDDETEELSSSNGNESNENFEIEHSHDNERLVESYRIPVLPALYNCIIRCCLDKASTVRLRAMFHLASLIESENHCGQLDRYARKMFEENPKVFTGEIIVSETEELEEDHFEMLEKMFLDDSEIVINNIILHIILSGSVDDTAGVRKYSLIALQAYFPRIKEISEAENAVDSLKDCCLDTSLMVRRQAAETLDHLLCTSKQFRELLESAWLTAVLPMINDREHCVQRVIAGLITKTILNPLLLGDTSNTTWKMLHAIELENNNRRLLHRALIQEHQDGNIKQAIITCLNHKLMTCPAEVDVIWMLLADLSSLFKVKPEKAVEAWYEIMDGDPRNKVRYVSRVLSRCCGDLDANSKMGLSVDIERKISQFRIAAPNISSAYLCLAKLMDAVGEESMGKGSLEKLGRKLLRICREHIRESLLKIKDEYGDPERLNARETLLIRVVLTIGEVVQFSPNLMSSAVRLFDALKTILASDIFNEEELSVINSAVPSILPSPSCSREHSPSRPPSSLSDQDERMGSIPVSSQNAHVIPLHILEASKANRRALLTERVRAHAVLTIGKFCLMNEKIAKSTIPVFVKQLRLNTDHVIRNNIAVVICDLCIRYTSMVDRYSPIVAACLKDKSTLVRQQTLESLTSLIKEQFIRWEGQIMYRFVSTILDENKVIREYTKFCLRDVLLMQFPDLFSNHFIECLMYFNKVSISCETGSGVRVQNVVDPVHHVALYGPDNFDNRMTIYKFMLSTFDDRLKFTLMAHICTQIISPIMNGNLKYEDPCVYALLRDSLTVMSLKEIKLNMDVGKGPDDEDEPPAVVVAAAKEMITQTFRKAMIEYVMPTLLDLRVYLNERRSRLRAQLYSVFRAICRENKDQIDEFLDGDQQLKAEVEYDIRRYELHLKAEWALARRRAEQSALERRLSRRSFVPNKDTNGSSRISSQRAVTHNEQLNSSGGSKTVPVVDTEMNQKLVENITDLPTIDVNAVKPSNALSAGKSRAIQNTLTKSARQNIEALSEESAPVDDSVLLTAKTVPSSLNTIEEVCSSTKNHPCDMEVDIAPRYGEDICSAPKSIINVDPVIFNDKQLPEKENRHGSLKENSQRAAQSSLISASKISPKVTTEQTTNWISNEPVVSPRAISTPNKAISNLTFADLNLSAIQREGKRVSHKKTGLSEFPNATIRSIEEEQI